MTLGRSLGPASCRRDGVRVLLVGVRMLLVCVRVLLVGVRVLLVGVRDAAAGTLLGRCRDAAGTLLPGCCWDAAGTLRDVAGVHLCNLCPPTTLSLNMRRTAAKATILVGPLTGKDRWAQICHGAYFF